MEALLARLGSQTGLDAATAKAAVGHILAFVKAEGTDPAVGDMIARTPGAEDAIVAAGETSSSGGGFLGGLMGSLGGGGIMALGAKLMGLGLDMEQIKTVALELVAFAKLHAGEETVDRALASVPGLNDYL